MRSRLPACRAIACVFSSCACPAHIANSPSKATIFGESIGGADDVPERGFAGRGRDADARGAAVDVVGDVGRFDVAGERADAASLGLGEQRMIGEAVIFEQRLQRAGAAPEAERVDRQHRDIGRDVVAAIAGGLVLPRRAPRP